jgi:hypothetical protein
MKHVNQLLSKRIVTAMLVAVLGTTAIIGIGVSRTQAVTAAELIELLIIANVIPQENAEQARAVLAQQQDGDGVASSVCPYTWTRNLTQGSTGNDVRQLQIFLNDQSGVQVAVAGPGSPGQETSYFGSLTAGAVAEFQSKYAAEVLAPVGLTQPTGFFGPSTRSKANELCRQVTIPDDEEDETEDDTGIGSDEENGSNEDEDGDTETDAREAFISDFELTGSPSNADLSEGERENVLGFTFEVNNSDVRVQRVDLLAGALDQNNGEDPFDYIDTITLYHDGDRVDEWDADDEDNWSSEGNSDGDIGDSGNELWRFRMSGFDIDVADGEEPEFVIAFTAQSNLDSDDLPQNFELAIAGDENDDGGVRAVDAAGIQHEFGSTNDTEEVSFEESDNGSLTVSSNSNNPDSRVVHVDDSSDTDDVTSLIFDIDADDQDIQLNELIARAAVTGASDINDVVSTLYLYQDDQLLASESVPSVSGQSATITFEDLDFVIEDGERLPFEVRMDLFETDGGSNYADGTTVEVDVSADDIEAEEVTGEENDLSGSDLRGDARGERMYLYDVAPQFSLRNTDAAIRDSGDDVTSGEYSITFEVTADEDEDIYIPFYSSTESESIVAKPTDGNGRVVAVPEFDATISRDRRSDSGVEREDDTWIIPSGETGVFTLKSVIDNDGGSATRFLATKITSLKWNTSDSTIGLTEFTFNLESWETDPVSLNN